MLGGNTYGQLGNSTTNDSSTPVAVDTSGVLVGKTILQISTGYYHTCAIASDNQAYCWGLNDAGQLGGNSTANSNVPVAVSQGETPTGVTFTQISVGNSYTSYSCALASNGKVYCWGGNNYGQLGGGADPLGPVVISQDESTISQISLNDNYLYIITSDNRIYYSNLDYSTELLSVKLGYILRFSGNVQTNHGIYVDALDNEYDVGYSNTRLKIFAPAHQTGTKDITLHSVTDNIAYNTIFNAITYIDPSPKVASITPNNSITTGNITTVIKGNYFTDLKPVNNFTQISVGDSHTCALDSNGRAYCWGLNSSGQLGNGVGAGKKTYDYKYNGEYDHSTPVAVSQGAVPSDVTFT